MIGAFKQKIEYYNVTCRLQQCIHTSCACFDRTRNTCAMKSDPKAAELVLRNIKKVPDIHADINLLHFEENRQCLVGLYMSKYNPFQKCDILHSYGSKGNMRLLNNIDKSCNIMILMITVILILIIIIQDFT